MPPKLMPKRVSYIPLFPHKDQWRYVVPGTNVDIINIFLKLWWYNTDNVNDSVKTNTRYTWLTWLETLDRVSGLAVGILITLVTRLIIATGTKELKQNKIFDKLEAILKKSE